MRGDLMRYKFKNLVFSGGGALGIAYLGSLEYLYKTGLIHPVINLAGTSAGAITACLTSFNTSFSELITLSRSLDYHKVTQRYDSTEDPRILPQIVKDQIGKISDNFECVYRLVKKFGWYSSQYFYDWIKEQIANQFDPNKKLPPYTFADFKDATLHKDQRIFKNLYIIGTDVSKTTSIVFSYETTPYMEVAEAVRISMSVPLLFESITSSCDISNPTPNNLYIDGGMLYNYPINLFDTRYPLKDTLGIYFKSTPKSISINNLLDFISSTLSCSISIQNTLFETKPKDVARSICIQTGDISSFNFDISLNDPTYEFLYNQGYRSTEIYFSLLKH